MTTVEIPISSAVINVINIVALQLVLVPIVTRSTSLLAGFNNYKRQNGNEPLALESFDAPVVGENLVMSKGFKRGVMIGIRVSVVIAIGISNVGLEGRSRARKVVQESVIYGPGFIPQTEKNSTQLQGRLVQQVTCNIVQGDGRTHKFGSVIDGTCHRDVTDFAYIKEMKSDSEDFNMSIGICDSLRRQNWTIHKCGDVEFVCSGERSDEQCVAVRYGSDGETAWQCELASIVGGSKARLSDCRRVTAPRENLIRWIDALTRFGLKGMFALFASAYGVERRENIELEDGEEEVTIVTLLWMLPAGWIVLVILLSMSLIVWKKIHHEQAVAHDERNLFGLLDKRIVVTDDNECVVTYSTTIDTTEK